MDRNINKAIITYHFRYWFVEAAQKIQDAQFIEDYKPLCKLLFLLMSEIEEYDR